jgi:hypothetical protein
MKFLSLLIVSALTLSSMAFGCSEDGTGGIIESNSIQIPVGLKLNGGISEAQFNKVIDDVEGLYSPVVASMGGKMEVARLWKDATANANATRLGKTWHINMYGGLARHPAITMDGFYLVLCHELGHHIGGAPKTGLMLGMMKWASNEGQADYFATLKCLRNVFLHDNNLQITSSMKVPDALATACAKTHPGADDQAICIRSGMAGASVAGFFAAARKEKEAQFSSPDAKIVSRTNDDHPATQCRLDTYFQGALCEKAFTEEVSQKDEVQGTCHSSTGYTVGIRPLCWFKPSK